MGTEQKRGVLLSAAPIAPGETVPYVPQRGDYVVCADGGLRLAKRLGVRPQLIVGDFDSGKDPASCPDPLFEGVPVLRVPSEKDDTDTKLGLEQLFQRGAVRRWCSALWAGGWIIPSRISPIWSISGEEECG